MNYILDLYKKREKEIKKRLKEFKELKKEDYPYELLFCILTPQSNAKKCWEAIEIIKKEKNLTYKKINKILKKRTRFYNNKTKYLIESLENWKKIETRLQNNNIKELRNWLAENVKGIGMKEAGHFLRNIGKSNNEIAILDRHILKNLKKLDIIKEEKIKNKADYLEKEKIFLEFANNIKIAPDELDLLLWSKESGEIFK